MLILSLGFLVFSTISNGFYAVCLFFFLIAISLGVLFIFF